MERPRRPTLRDVAAAARVSHMTISRVVRGDPKVARETRDHVQQVIAWLGYRPDPALSALAAYRTRGGGGRGSTLAFLSCDTDNYGREVGEGARQEAERLGYTLEVHPLPKGEAGQRRLSRVLFHRGVQGLLFGPSAVPRELMGWTWEHFAPVSLGALPHAPAMNSVALDYFDGAVKAEACLREAGARRIGLVIDAALEARTGHRWRGGYLASRAGERVAAVYSGDYTDADSLRHWQRKHRIDGVLTIHRPVWSALRDSAVKMVFLNPIDCPPGVLHIASDPRKIGLEGVRLLHHQILTGEFGLPGELKTVALQGALRGF